MLMMTVNMTGAFEYDKLDRMLISTCLLRSLLSHVRTAILTFEGERESRQSKRQIQLFLVRIDAKLSLSL